MTGLPFVCEAKSYAVESFRPHLAVKWVAKVDREALAGRFRFGLVALDLGGARRFGSCLWLASDASVSPALMALPELVPAQTVSSPMAFPPSVFVLVQQSFQGIASL